MLQDIKQLEVLPRQKIPLPWQRRRVARATFFEVEDVDGGRVCQNFDGVLVALSLYRKKVHQSNRHLISFDACFGLKNWMVFQGQLRFTQKKLPLSITAPRGLSCQALIYRMETRT